MKVLYLSVWYPSKHDKMAGLFVQKHVQAVTALGAEVRVNTIWPRADVTQLNVLSLKTGLVALAHKLLFNIPYFIVEHWSAYLPENGTFIRQNKLKLSLLKYIAKNATSIYPVSQRLEDAMKSCGISNQNWGRMYNVVDDFFFDKFTKAPSPDGKVRLLHVSCFNNKPKNITGLLRSVKALSLERQDFILTLVGNGEDWQMCRDYADELEIPASLLRWTGSFSPREVCDEMRRSDFFVLPSRWENAPVVLSESMASGLPIISTTAGGIPEMVNSGTGILVSPGDDEALTEALRHMIEHYREYDEQVIRSYAGKYSFQEVGRLLIGIYKQILE